jgi:hypothetical protein
MIQARTVVYAHCVQARLEEIYGSPELADIALIGPSFVLARDPKSGEQLSSDVWFISLEAKGVWRGVGVFYRFDDDEVVILDITVD